MVNVRPEHEPNPEPRPGPVRFNVLLTEDREQAIEHWTRQLPRLLQPQGVQAYVARSGREALELTTRVEIHAALVDLATPAESRQPRPLRSTGAPGGLWLLELFRRLPQRPPTVVVNSTIAGQRQAQRLLNHALRLGAFSVVNRPVELETLLEVIRRLIDRRYAGTWPSPGQRAQPPPGGAAAGQPDFHRDPNPYRDHPHNPGLT